jgi:hypothetical protein
MKAGMENGDMGFFTYALCPSPLSGIPPRVVIWWQSVLAARSQLKMRSLTEKNYFTCEGYFLPE